MLGASVRTEATMRMWTGVLSSVRRHRGRWVGAGALAVAAVGFALYWFAPWNLVVDRRVDEALPAVDVDADATGDAADAGEPAAGTDEPTDGPTDDGDDPVARRTTLARGSFADLEHATSGSVVVIELEDGSRFLRLQDLDTSNGPDLRVLLSDQPLSTDWDVWDDGVHVDLGALRGNLGSSNYALPDDLDLSAFRSAVIWCRRFTVGFGVAPLEPSSA
ncbi:MAG: DM13 domain-containing protein [Actinomycetota bacterium]